MLSLSLALADGDFAVNVRATSSQPQAQEKISGARRNRVEGSGAIKERVEAML